MKNLFFKAFIVISGISIITCNKDDPSLEGIDFKQEMKDFVQAISEYSRQQNPDFIIIPQNGQELITINGEENGNPDLTYLNAIDGQGREDLYYGYNRDNRTTPDDETDYMENFLDIAKDEGVEILVTDYCSDHDKMDDSYSKSNQKAYISFAANHRELDNIPDYPSKPYGENDNEISSLSEISNFLYLINPEDYSSKSDFINAVTSTNYDLIIMDYFFNENEEFTNTEIEQLKNKANGGKRLVISYMSIGEAEDYRYYWNNDWEKGDPEWLYDENPDWEGNFKVRYWDKEWQSIIFGNGSAYLDKIIGKGFNGVYLDIIDGFEYFEEL
ncbi:MAG: endo alpha-1,4 polygalactosaminidase [Bacteroidales bacterium]|nr:endo alpha-1,4 polygalactosaminidase [Bacteroidales bacterium]